MNNSMENFFLCLKSILKENPDFNFDRESLYSYLTRFNIRNEDRDIDLQANGNFTEWIDHFAHKQNIRAFVDPQWDYFCQFLNVPQNDQRGFNHIKIYIPLDAKHIRLGSKMLFEFLDQNNIKTHSKIGKRIRQDDIVIRTYSIEDAKKIIDFVNQNDYLKEGLYPPIPFSYDYNGIAMTFDRSISYNMTMAIFTSEYLSIKKQNNQVDRIDENDFILYLIDIYNYYFANNQNRVDEFISRFIPDKALDPEKNSIFVNYEEVISLAIQKNNIHSLQDFENIYKYTCAVHDAKVTNLNEEQYRMSQEVSSEQIMQYFSELVYVMTKKFGVAGAKNNLRGFVRDGNYHLITRTNDLRDRLIAINFYELINSYLRDNNIDFDTFYNYFEVQNVEYNDSQEQILGNALFEAYMRFGGGREATQKVAIALYQIIQQNSYIGITRNNNARMDLMQNVSPEDLRGILQRHGIVELSNDEDYNKLIIFINQSVMTRNK